MKNHGFLGLALAAIAFGGFGATTAFADELTAESYPAVLTGMNDPGYADQFITTAGTFICKDPTYTATIAKSTTTVSVTPNFSSIDCTVSGKATPIHTNGCTYTFSVQGGSSTTGDADLICPVGSEFTIELPTGCTIHVKGQSDIEGTITYTGLGSGTTREITLNAELSGIDYTHTSKFGLGCTMGSATNGTLKAKAVVRGETHEGMHMGLLLSNL